MKAQHRKILLTILIIGFLFYIDPVYAGPGGSIVKGLFKTWWGKLIIGAIVIIFLPLVIYNYTVEFFAIKKTKAQLDKVGLKNRDFTWLNLQKNVTNIFQRVYIAWDKGDMQEVSQYVNHWYWQNQQQVHLNRWEAENLKNICKLDKIKSIKPIYAEILDENNFEGSKVAFLISANIKDYLIDKDTRKVVEGKAAYGDEEHIWILEYTEGKWLLDDIRDGSFSLAFAKTKNVVPESVFGNATA